MLGEVRFPPFPLGGRIPSLQPGVPPVFRYPLLGAPQVGVAARFNLPLGGTYERLITKKGARLSGDGNSINPRDYNSRIMSFIHRRDFEAPQP